MSEEQKSPKLSYIPTFLYKLQVHANRKALLYDGVEATDRVSENNVDFYLRLATEELGEIASAITRERYNLAEEECLDLAHCAMLIAMHLDQRKK